MDEDDVYECYFYGSNEELCGKCEFCKEARSPRTGNYIYRCSKNRKKVSPYDCCNDYKEVY